MAELTQTIAVLRALAARPSGTAVLAPRIAELASVVAKQTGASVAVRPAPGGNLTVVFSGRQPAVAAMLLRSRLADAVPELGGTVAASIIRSIEGL